ncbi:acyl-CoA N-acyltransferase [Lipomyces orientalis]|uniref:Acyl-CoA N-acyltransferase n=1 Tax=Lipomyces orientalis TaxID=1233043 RepID=A0ACC3TIZ1_9ASCO
MTRDQVGQGGTLSDTTQALSQTRTDRAKSVTIRDARLDDAAAIAHLGSQVFAATFGHSVAPQDLNDYLERAYSVSQITRDLSNPQRHFFVACVDQDRVVGFSELREGSTEDCVSGTENPVELFRLYVDLNFHGAGVGRGLIEEVEDLAKERGFKTLWLGVWEENLKAQKVYEKMGFVRVGDHVFKVGEVVQTDYIMSKSI